jgi:hypothetical protein
MDFEKLGAFYVGRRWDSEKQAAGDAVLVDARDLTTHALIVGMTGSGKTGLGVDLLEEAAIDGIPAIVIDPKGDLANLLLVFPELRAEDFAPWVEPGEDPAQVAERWKKGLADWGQDGTRVARFRDAAEVALYTPGSSAGRQLAVLGSLAPPAPSVAASPELLRDRVTAAAAGLLHLAGVDSDPLRGREHILVASILERLWSEGRPADLAGLVQLVQKPPFDRVGVLELESFYPAAARFELATSLNALLASPGFSAWTRGEPLDPARLLVASDGRRPRLAVISIAHLSEPERMSFVTLLLSEIIAWMRALPGTSSLRALLYMDEIAGYFPPVANPPSKAPMLALLKQARAYGLGVVLATQNPVDLDYKGLANCGTWFVGRLQAERDKLRLLDGLEAASAVTGQGFARAEVDRLLSGLDKRVFFMHSVHAGDTLFMTRWSLSYLRGPMTREQIAAVSGSRGEAPAAPVPPAAPPPVEGAAQRPVLPPEIPELFVARAGAAPTYRPAVFGSARIRYASAKLGVDHWETVILLAPLAGDADAVDWTAAEDVSSRPPALEKQPVDGARFAPLPAAAARAASYRKWERALAMHLLEHRRLDMFRVPDLREVSRPGETEAELRLRVMTRARETRDAEVARLRRSWEARLAAAEERVRKAEAAIGREEAQVRSAGTSVAVDAGTAILGAFFGRRRISPSRLGSAARGAGRIAKERADVARAEEDLEAARARRAEVESSLQAAVAAMSRRLDSSQIVIEPAPLAPRKGDITVGTVALVWVPER